MTIKKMNGKDLIYQGFADFDDPNKAFETGKHTALEPFEAAMKRSARHGVSVYGWVWAEWSEERTCNLSAMVKKPRLTEVVLKPQRQWAMARVRAHQENELIVVLTSHAKCCIRMIHCMEDHQKTARHFRYWCLQFPELAVRAWPWIKELIAEEVLTCEER